MAAKEVAVKVGSLLLGTCLPSLKSNVSKIKVRHLVFDSYLNMYFPNFYIINALDLEKICKTGDIVLVKKLENKITTSVTHKVLEVVYPCGDVTDPVTGKKVVFQEYRDIMDETDSLYGNNTTRFNYNTAPKRGWQEGKKDFSNKEIYMKYHEFDDDEEDKHQPYSANYCMLSKKKNK